MLDWQKGFEFVTRDKKGTVVFFYCDKYFSCSSEKWEELKQEEYKDILKQIRSTKTLVSIGM